MKEIAAERQENEDESGLLFDLHDKMRVIVTEYNDTIKGRCAVCLENLGDGWEDEGYKMFLDNQEQMREAKMNLSSGSLLHALIDFDAIFGEDLMGEMYNEIHRYYHYKYSELKGRLK